jgi:hypothetical protein
VLKLIISTHSSKDNLSATRCDCSSTQTDHRNRYGLLSEDVDPQTGALWGNFPQTYSMAGLILSAMRLSRSWEDRYWRG